MFKINKKIKEQFETSFYEIVKTNSTEDLEKFLLTSPFKTFPNQYKQLVMDYLVCGGYKEGKENQMWARWALTTKIENVQGDIHENGDRPLRLSSQYNIEFAKYLLTSPELKEKADINATDDGSSAILEAINTNNLDFVKYLLTSSDLEVKAKLDIADNEFNDPLCKSCDKNYTEIVKYLLSNEYFNQAKEFNVKINLQRFDYHGLGQIIRHDNLELFNFIIDNKLINLLTDLDKWYCKAIISDSVNIANYLENFYTIKPDLHKMRYDSNSLFFMVAKCNHYARMENHSYLKSMIETYSYTADFEEIKSMNGFYVYNKDDSAVPLSSIVNFCSHTEYLDNKLKIKNIKSISSKI